MDKHNCAVDSNERSLAAKLLPDVIAENGVPKIIRGFENLHAATARGCGPVEVFGNELAFPAMALKVTPGLSVSVQISFFMDGV